MKKKSPKCNGIFIHVKAQSEVLSINAIVPEVKCVSILEELRDNFKYLKAKFDKPYDNLVVHTCVHNPTLL